MLSACDPGPRCALAERHGFRDLVAALACEAPRERIAENGIGPFRFAGAVNGREERGVGDVADEGISGAHSDSLPRFRSLSDSRIGIHTLLTPPQYHLPYYWYLDPARQEEFDRNIESLAKWIEGATQRFRSGVKNSRVIELHDTNHYVFIVDEALVVREMRKFLLQE
jgi:hypothetical protein